MIDKFCVEQISFLTTERSLMLVCTRSPLIMIHLLTAYSYQRIFRSDSDAWHVFSKARTIINPLMNLRNCLSTSVSFFQRSQLVANARSF